LMFCGTQQRSFFVAVASSMLMASAGNDEKLFAVAEQVERALKSH